MAEQRDFELKKLAETAAIEAEKAAAQRQHEIEIKRMEREQQVAQADDDRARNDSVAARLKRYGDAMRNAMTRQGADPIETVSFFRNAENLFRTLEVPQDLRAVLIRPFLNDKAKALIARLEPHHASDYDALKALILRENKLTPTTYREKFTTLKKAEGETYVMYSSRLLAMLESYHQSRSVSGFKDLVELLLCDRLKLALSPELLKQVLSVESTVENGWLQSKLLAELIDNFVANHVGDRLRTGASGNEPPNYENGKGKGPNPQTEKVAAAPENAGDGEKKQRLCFICHSPHHLRAQCPHNKRNKSGGTTGTYGPGRTGLPRQVNNCLAEQPEVVFRSTEIDDFSSSGGENAPARGGPEQCVPSEGCVNDVCVEQSGSLECDIAKLRYVNVSVAGQPESRCISVSALEDSGSQIAVIHESLTEQLENVAVVGAIKIRGVIGEPIQCNLVKLYLRLSESNLSSVPVICAVSDVANNDLLLPADVMNRLRSAYVDSDDPDDMSLMDANVVTRSGLNTQTDTSAPASLQDDCDTQPEFIADLVGSCSDDTSAREILCQEQHSDPTLLKCWKLCEKGKGNFEVVSGVLMRKEKLLGREVKQLVLPQNRRKHVLEMGHGLQGAHMAWRNTSNRIRYNFWWPTVRADIIDFVSQCAICQQKSRITCWDRVPIQPIPRADEAFMHWWMDVGGPLSSAKLPYNYFLVLCDSCTRFPVAFALRSVNSRSIADCLLSLWQFVGVPSWVSCDNASYNVSKLMKELMQRMGCSPRFITPGHSQADGLAERLVGSTKALIAKVAADHPKQWHKYLGYVMWALREIPNESTKIPPVMLAFGKMPHGPLAILKETWCAEREFPPDLGKSPVEYLQQLQTSLQLAQQYANQFTSDSQLKYTERYNKRAKDKKFALNEDVLILRPDSTASRVFSKWLGPAKVVTVKSPYSYIVRLGTADYHVHANDLRRYNVRSDEVRYTPSAIAAGSDDTVTLEPGEDGDISFDLDDHLSAPLAMNVATCAVIYQSDTDFGRVPTVNTPTQNAALPSHRIDQKGLEHLTTEQRQQLLKILDEFSDVFRDQPGLCTAVQHEIPLTADFVPRRLRAYRIPDRLKPEVERQLRELADNGFIKKSSSPMASPLVCVLKGPGGRDGVRLAVDFRFVNAHTIPDVFPVPDMAEVIQKIGRARYITVCDASQGYWQTPVKSEDQWKTGFVCGDELWTWTRTPYGMRCSGNTFCRAIRHVLKDLHEYAASYIDDMAVYSDQWEDHCWHLRRFLETIRQAGITLKLKKCHFALPEVKFCGQLVGSGTRRADPEKVSAIHRLQVPETKKNVRQVLGFFSYFREHIPHFAEMAKPLTDLTAKGIPNQVPWGSKEQAAFNALKTALVKATEERLHIVDPSKPFSLLDEASDHSVSGVLLQLDSENRENPIAFHSQKLTPTQQRYATVEKEAYAAIVSLRKYRQWVFGAKICIYSDHNPLTFLTVSAPKSAKLMRWALALQEFEIDFRYRAGRNHIVPDVLTRLVD